MCRALKFVQTTSCCHGCIYMIQTVRTISHRTQHTLKSGYTVFRGKCCYKPEAQVSHHNAFKYTDCLRTTSFVNNYHDHCTRYQNLQPSQQSVHLHCTQTHLASHRPLLGHHYYTGLLLTNYNNINCSNQIRYFSSETYYSYFSPDFFPIGFAQKVLEQVHDITGLPWWASILFTTFTLRTIITLPLAVHAMKIIAKVELLQPEVKELSNELKKEVAMAVKKFGWSQPKARLKYNVTMKKLVKDLYVRDNCHPMKASVLALVQLPMWFCLSFALRNMSGAVPVAGLVLPVLCPSLITEGALWFTNLTVPDPTWIIPISMGVFNLLNIEIHGLERENPKRMQKIVTNFMRVISILMIGIGGLVPTSMSLYWSCSSLFGVIQTLVFKSVRVRRALGIPKTPRESSTPFRDLWAAARKKYTWKRN